MHNDLPTELYLLNRPGTPSQVERVCEQATTNIDGGTVAVAVAASNVSRAALLLFGTGIGIVGSLDEARESEFVGQARLSLAAGATEISLPSIALDQTAVVKNLKAFLGTATPLTVDITTTTGEASLDHAEHALVLGANFVAYAPPADAANVSGQMANLVALTGELRLGGVKLAGTSDHPAIVLRENEWAMTPGNSRLCLPVTTTA